MCKYLLALVLWAPTTAWSQALHIDSLAQLLNRPQFFQSTAPLELTVVTHYKTLRGAKEKKIYQPARVTLKLPGGELVMEDIRVYARGNYRRKYCYMPGLMMNFRNPESPNLSPLKKMKTVCGCGPSRADEQLVLAEYLVYKIYQQLTDVSFAVRLVRMHYTDALKASKPYSQYGFFIEDVDELAARFNSQELNNRSFLTEQTARQPMTLLALFQYMIGNTDWAVPNNHNVKLIRSMVDTAALPLVVPYDFDFSGIVNAPYAVPYPELGIEKVTDRLYRGFVRSESELAEAVAVFQTKKRALYEIINNFTLLDKRKRNEMIIYMEQFYAIIDNKRSVAKHFIDGARTY